MFLLKRHLVKTLHVTYLEKSMKNWPCGRHEQSCHLVSARPSAWWCCGSGHVTSPKHPTGALQTHARLLVRNGSPWPCSQGHSRGDQLVVSLLPSAIGFLLLSQVGSMVAVRMSYCGWTSSKTFPPAPLLILSLRTLCVYVIQTIFIMKSAKWKSENLCFEIPQVPSSPETSDGLDADSHRKASCPRNFLSPKSVM